MLAHERLLDLVRNFILLDDSKPGGTRKIVARNHQVLGVNSAVASVERQEKLKRQFPPEKRLITYTSPETEVAIAAQLSPGKTHTEATVMVDDKIEGLPLVQRAH